LIYIQIVKYREILEIVVKLTNLIAFVLFAYDFRARLLSF
jgi:hypothetical protein